MRTIRPGLALVTALAFVATALTMAPTAAAHDCEAEDPATSCGDCDDLLPHDHEYNDGRNYCRSDPLTSLCRSVDSRIAIEFVDAQPGAAEVELRCQYGDLLDKFVEVRTNTLLLA